MRFLLVLAFVVLALASSNTKISSTIKARRLGKQKVHVGRTSTNVAIMMHRLAFEGFEHSTSTAPPSNAVTIDVNVDGTKKEIKTTADQFLVTDDGVTLSYSEITAIAGDYFGPKKETDNIICSDAHVAGKRSKSGESTRFQNAFLDLWKNKNYGADTSARTTTLNWANKMGGMIKELRDVFAVEKAGIEKAVKSKSPTYGSDYYHSAPGIGAWDMVTQWGKHRMSPFSVSAVAEGNVDGLSVNDDHFSWCADATIKVGHSAALADAYAAGQQAKAKKFADAQKLFNRALGKSAFISHFFSDRFSSGHVRTPRVEIRNIGCANTISGDLSLGLTANVQHDEDNMNCLLVKNRLGHVWWSCGDHRYFDDVNAMNRKMIRDGTQAIMDDIRKAFEDGLNARPLVDTAVPLKWVPFTSNPDTAGGAWLTPRQQLENTCPMFKYENGKMWRRKNGALFTDVPRPAACSKEAKCGHSIFSTASATLIPGKFVEPTISTNVVSTGDCAYSEMGYMSCCTPAGRSTPQKSGDSFTYVNNCKLYQETVKKVIG